MHRHICILHIWGDCEGQQWALSHAILYQIVYCGLYSHDVGKIPVTGGEQDSTSLVAIACLYLQLNYNL